ncbi:MAG: hypothetical protein ACJ8FY_05390 [Gemmataceae bacterium]
MRPERERQAGASWLESKLATLEALYRKFGRDGLKDHSVTDVGLLLSSKELHLRDAAKSRDLGQDQKAENRQLELEIKDLTAYMKGQLAGVSLSDLRSFRQPDRPRQNEPQKRRDFDLER